VVPVYNAADPARAKKSMEILELSSRRIEVIESSEEIEGALGWASDEALLYSLRDTADSVIDFALWRLPIDKHTSQPRGKAVKIAVGRGWATDMAVASSGRALTLRKFEPSADAYVAEVTATTEHLTPRRITLDDWANYPFGWTADSTSVLMLSDRDGPLHLYKQPLDQVQPELLVGGDEILGIPRLAPFGNEVLYLQMPRSRASGEPVKIMRVPLSGGVPQEILQAPGIWNYQCAEPPAMLCLYSPTEANEQRFFAFDIGTGASHEMEYLRVPGPRPNWSLSPDGEHLAMQMLRPEEDAAIRIWKLSSASSRTIPLAGWPETVGIDWAPDGKSLWIAGKRSRAPGPRDCALLQVYVDGKIKVRFEDQSLCFLAGIPSPDGHHLALPVTLPNSSNVWLMENF